MKRVLKSKAHIGDASSNNTIIQNSNVTIGNYTQQTIFVGKKCYPLSVVNTAINNLDEIIQYNQTVISQSPIAPWLSSDGYNFNKIINGGCYVDSCVSSEELFNDQSSYPFSEVVKKLEGITRCIFVGSAGSGKSFLMKKYSLLLNAQGHCVLYISACNYSEENNFSQYVNLILQKLIDPPDNLLLIFDALDEKFANDYGALNTFINRVCDIKCGVWLACRKDFYNRNKCFEDKPFYCVRIQDWSLDQSLNFVKKFPANSSDVLEKFKNLIQLNNNIEEFSKNPLRLSMLVYLLDNQTESASRYDIYNTYLLYKHFFEEWVSNEIRRVQDNNIQSCTIFSKWQKIARAIYCNDDENCEVEHNPILLSILKTRPKDSMTSYVQDFFHRSFIEYLLAKEVIDATLNSSKAVIDVLKHNNRSDIDYFIKQSFKAMDYNKKNKAAQHLMCAYTAANQHLSDCDEIFYVQNQIVYLLTRMDSENERIQTFIRDIYDTENRPIMKQGIAYGAANIGVYDVALDFAEKMRCPNSNENLINRSWTLIFYGDQPGQDPIRYRDDSNVDWERSKAARLRRLSGSKFKDTAFRIFDLCILHGFYESRNWRNLSEEDLRIIENTNAEIPELGEKVCSFLLSKRSELVQEYRTHL